MWQERLPYSICTACSPSSSATTVDSRHPDDNDAGAGAAPATAAAAVAVTVAVTGESGGGVLGSSSLSVPEGEGGDGGEAGRRDSARKAAGADAGNDPAGGGGDGGREGEAEGALAEDGARPEKKKKSWLEVGGVLGTDELCLRNSSYLEGALPVPACGVCVCLVCFFL